MNKWEILDSKNLYKSNFGNVRIDKCLLPNGAIIESYKVNEYNDWVNCVAVTENNQVILVKQYRHGAGDFFWEIPAGGISKGENPISAVLRELQEETGYITNNKPILLSSLHTNPATNNNRIHTYLLTGLSSMQKVPTNFDITEDIECLLASWDEISEMVSNGTISQLFTLYALQTAKHFLYNGEKVL